MNATYLNEIIARQRIAEIESRARRPRWTTADRDTLPRRLVLRPRWIRRAPVSTGPMTVATS